VRRCLRGDAHKEVLLNRYSRGVHKELLALAINHNHILIFGFSLNLARVRRSSQGGACEEMLTRCL
jgi:hypothetical protein